MQNFFRTIPVFLLFFAHLAYGQRGTTTVIDTVYKDTVLSQKIFHERNPLRVGFSGNYGWNFYSNNKLPLPLGTNCDSFLSGTSTAPSFTTELLIPFDDSSRFSISPYISYRDLKGESKFGQLYHDTSGGVRDSLLFEHTITSHTKGIGIGAKVEWEFLKRFYLGGGAEVLALLDQTYDKVLTPNGPGGFAGGARDSLESSGDLPNAHSFLPSLLLSLRAEFPLSSRLNASPIVSLQLPLSGTTDYFHLFSLTGGIVFHYDLAPRADTSIEYFHEKVPVLVARQVTKAPRLEASIEAFGRNKSGIVEPLIRLEVTDVKAKVAFPFLNYVFFDEGSSDIPKRYETFPSSDIAQQKFKGTTDRSGEKILDLYHEMLNILGARLKSAPRARITLTGSTSNSGVETGNIGLARRRAETIKNYLVKIWQIAPDRILAEASILPSKPSPQSTKEGQEENRRVEISSTEEGITDPIIVTNTEHYATPSEIKLQPSIISEAGVRHLIATVGIGTHELIRYEGNLNNLAKEKDWAVTEEALSGKEDSLLLGLEVTDSAGKTIQARNTIGLQRMKTEREKEQELERFSLILFGFDEDVLGAKNERTVSLVAESFKRSNTSSLKIVGYTDETGDVNYNDDLSRRRAQEAAQYLERMLRAKKLSFPSKTLIEGKGSHERLFDNILPEGRFFSRTVNITLEKGK